MKKLKLTKNELIELLRQYHILYDLIETVPRRKIMVEQEKLWHQKKDEFLKNHPKLNFIEEQKEDIEFFH